MSLTSCRSGGVIPGFRSQQISLRLFADGDGELCLAGVGGIVEGVASAVGIGSFEKESVFQAVGQAGEAGLAVDVGADFKIELVGVEESIGDPDVDLGVIDRLVVDVGDSEIGRAGPKTAVDDRGGVRVGLGGCVLGIKGDGEGE